MVALTCSEPGVINSRHFDFNPCLAASLAIEAARVMASEDECAQLPINAALISNGQPLDLPSEPNS